MTNIYSIVDFIYILLAIHCKELNEVLKSYLLFRVCVYIYI